MGDLGKLQERLQKYISQTFEDIKTVKDFCEREVAWMYWRKEELTRIRDIKERAKKEKNVELEKELGQVLNKTVKGLMDLHPFLDAVEKLAVTSLSVFDEESVQLEGVSSEAVQAIILTARCVSPLLINFKRHAEAFFMPNLDNVVVLDFQLDKYILLTRKISRTISKITDFISIQNKPSWKFSFSVSGSTISTIDNLDNIRMDESFRLSFLFQQNAEHFIEMFSECRPRLFQFLSDLEESAVQLDRMKKGSSISSVAGSSVGIAGGVLSIVGLVLAPVTAGASLGFTMAGLGLGVTSGVNSLVTGITELSVNSHHVGKANDIFQKILEDVQKILDCLDEASSPCPVPNVEGPDVKLEAAKVIGHSAGIVRKLSNLKTNSAAVKVLRGEKVARTAVGLGLQEANAGRSISKLAADLPDIGQMAKGTSLALSKAARVGYIGLNALFIVYDIYSICNESVGLANGEKSETSQILRSRASLWRTEINNWDKMYGCLCKGKDMFQKNLNILDQPLDLV